MLDNTRTISMRRPAWAWSRSWSSRPWLFLLRSFTHPPPHRIPARADA